MSATPVTSVLTGASLHVPGNLPTKAEIYDMPDGSTAILHALPPVVTFAEAGKTYRVSLARSKAEAAEIRRAGKRRG